MLDDILDYTRDVRARPVWASAPAAVREGFRTPLPQGPTDLESVHAAFMRDILPFTAGNTHPGFMGWVQGGGTPVGTLAEMLAAGLNANLGGRDQIPIEVERQVLHWMRELFAFPPTASGLFVTGTSMANLMAVLIARTTLQGTAVRQEGLAAMGARPVAYTSAGAHQCVAQAMDLAGFGKDALRLVPMNARFEIDLAALEQAIAADRAAGFVPFLVVGTAGTVEVGAVDDLAAIAKLARRESLWFHVDGAFGALGMLAPELRPLLCGIDEADSIAFDFHKWGQVPYDAGFLLVRDGQRHQEAFASPAAYLRRESRGLAAGSPWPCDFGPDLSRGFRALKTWFTFRVFGAERLGRAIAATCELARHLARRIEAEAALELLAPVALNIVCFRYRCEAADAVNAEIVFALQESGLCAPSSTTIGGRFAIRAAIVNHRTERADVDLLIESTLRFGRCLAPPPSVAGPVLASTETLLLQGGDERLAIDPASGRNRYGCAPMPEPAVAAFGSSTATSISAAGFAAADRLRQRLQAALATDAAGAVLGDAADHMGEALKQLCGLADRPGLGVRLAASGTDLHRIAVERVRTRSDLPPRVIMMEAAETGSGVAAALAGGDAGRETAPELVEVALRRPDGVPRPLGRVHAEIEAQVESAAGAGRPVLLIVLDVSKTGLLAPAPAFAAELHRRFAPGLEVMVDACQFRLSRTSLRGHLDRGFSVAVTGSKFLTGPSFCGALFTPSGGRTGPVDADVHPGLLLRWEAALAELQAFGRVPGADTRAFIEAFGDAVQRRLDADPALEPLPGRPLDRALAGAAADWDALPTVFPFLLYRRTAEGTRLPLTRDETSAVHRRLPEANAPDDAPATASCGLRCQVGQPVACGSRSGTPVSALRLCLGARLIVEATADGGRRAQQVIDRALAVLDKAAWLASTLHPVAERVADVPESLHHA